MKFSLPGARALIASSLAAGLSLLIAACGQEPGRTGLDYLETEGVRIAAPLYHLSFDDLPVDSVFGTEVPLNHYGESLLVVGREGDYVAKARMGFQFSSQAQLDSLVDGLFLRLTAIPLTAANDSGQNFAGRSYLRKVTQGRDSIRLLVTSYSFADSGAFSDSLFRYHNRIITTPTPFSTFGTGRRTLDTVTVYPRRAYPDSGVTQIATQTASLPHLWNRLRTSTDTSRKWAVFIELAPLTTSDSGLFHFIGQAASNTIDTLRRYNSGLWAGRYNNDSLATVGLMIKPYFSSSSGVARPATNFEWLHHGTSTRSLLHGVARGVHLRINRDTLLNRIRLKLNAFDPLTPTLGDNLMGSNPGVNFDRRFFVPYAEMRLPIDAALTKVPGPFALDLSVTTDVDSLGLDTAVFREDITLATGSDSLTLAVHGGGSTSTRVDNLIVKYRVHPVDSTLRQVLTRWANDPSVADTFTTVPDGRHRELTLTRRTGWSRSAVLSVKPSSSQLRLEVYFNVGSLTEARNIVDSTGKDISVSRNLTRRFYRPGADSLNVRVTRGLRNLLNRAYTPGTSIAPDMVLRSVERAAYDTSAVRGSTYLRVVYPLSGEIDFKRAGDGRLKVGLELYLYPLEAGQ